MNLGKKKKKEKEKSFLKSTEETALSHGFHSCKFAKGAKYHGTRVYQFVIPKGAFYYESDNTDNEYLSNKIYLKSAKPIDSRKKSFNK